MAVQTREQRRLRRRRRVRAKVRGSEARTESSIAKVHVAESVHRVVDRVIQICGALGLTEELPLGAFFTESRAFRIYDGPSEVHRMVIAREYLK